MSGKSKKRSSKSTTRKSTQWPIIRSFTRTHKILIPSIFIVLFSAIGITLVNFGHAQTPYTLVCDLQSPSVCMQLTPNKIAAGTEIDAARFNASTSAENFNIEYLAGMCGNGLVTLKCPFTLGSGLNARYLNDPIIQFKYMGGGNYCLGTLYNGSVFAGLQRCNTLSGSGGGQGTVFVIDSYKKHASGYIESRYFSDQMASKGIHDQPAWLCNLSNGGDLITLSGSNSYRTACQWIPEN
jgi:hypothetical protein